MQLPELKSGAFPFTVWVFLPIILLLFGLGNFPIYIVDEARNAQAAWEMFQAGEWVVPTFNEGVRTDKPPLHYYVMILFYGALGKTAVAARLGSAICGILTMGGIWWFTRKYWGRVPATLAVIVYGLSLYVPIQFFLATPDPYLALAFTLGMLLLYDGYTTGRLGPLLFGYLGLGLAILAKGPVALILAFFGGGLFLLLSPGKLLQKLKLLKLPLGLATVLVVAVPWFVAVHEATDGLFTHDFFLEHNFQRFTNTKEGHGGPSILILGIASFSLFPYSFWLPQALSMVWKKREGALLYCASVGLAVIVFFALSQTKLPSYPFPALGFLAIMIGVYLADLLQGRLKLGDKISFYSAALIFFLLPLGAYLGFKQDAVLKPLAHSWWIIALIWLPTLLAIFFWLRRKYGYGLLSLGVTCFSLHLVLASVFAPRIADYNQVDAALPLLKEAPEMVALGRFAPAYVFYLDEYVERLGDEEEMALWLATAPEGALILTAERFRELIPEGTRLTEVFRQKDLFEYPTTIIYRYDGK
jgi:hypothetical protein